MGRAGGSRHGVAAGDLPDIWSVRETQNMHCAHCCLCDTILTAQVSHSTLYESERLPAPQTLLTLTRGEAPGILVLIHMPASAEWHAGLHVSPRSCYHLRLGRRCSRLAMLLLMIECTSALSVRACMHACVCVCVFIYMYQCVYVDVY